MKRRSLLGAALLPAFAHAQAQPRIVSVGGAVTETVFALGAQGQLVGVDTTSLFPVDATRLPQVGYARTLSAEGVLALKPQLLLASGEAGPPLVLTQLKGAGLRVEVMDDQHRFDGVLARTQRIGELCGREREAAQLGDRLQQAWATRPKPPAGSAPRVLFVLAHAAGQLRVAGEGTGAHAMLTLAGARNAFAGVQGYKPLTAESALQAAPDIILCTDQGLAAQGGADGLLKAPGLALTPAGRARRVVGMEALLLLGFGPRLPQAVAELTRQLHGHAA
ncbi:heme/hemin ABC transporter substrate-binding protein [Roseateles sp. LYH14W]|uniref:Hemin ABC transporter substrate-binding protein n=1 Tax=Pelomonas parva TaxID=3299032 RepID=A0ABW7F9H5_9BURK